MRQTAFETAFLRLLAECLPLVSPRKEPLRKWVYVKKNEQQLRAVRSDAGAILFGMAVAESRYSDLTSYRECQRLYKADRVFKEATRLAGYWGKFSTVLHTIASEAGTIRRGRVHVDPDRALSQIRTLREYYSSSSFKYECRARINGVDLTTNVFSLPDGIELRRLSLRELNQRQAVIEPYMPHWGESPPGPVHRVEARFYEVVPIDRTRSGAFFEAGSQASAKATKVFDRVADAITAATGVAVNVGRTDLTGGFNRVGSRIQAQELFQEQVRLDKETASKVATAYRLLKGTSGDKVLGRALHRAILGNRRRDLIDRLVDYVIAWEAVLLTQKGSPATQELSYRFAVNGAVLLARVKARRQRQDMFQKMHSAYAARSCVVHGSDDKSLTRALKGGNFTNLSELCRFLERALREVFFWLDALPASDRPYQKLGGWDDLLWR